MKKETLLTVHNYAKQYKNQYGKRGVTVAYIYRLVAKGLINSVKIDGIIFIKL